MTRPSHARYWAFLAHRGRAPRHRVSPAPRPSTPVGVVAAAASPPTGVFPAGCPQRGGPHGDGSTHTDGHGPAVEYRATLCLGLWVFHPARAAGFSQTAAPLLAPCLSREPASTPWSSCPGCDSSYGGVRVSTLCVTGFAWRTGGSISDIVETRISGNAPLCFACCLSCLRCCSLPVRGLDRLLPSSV